METIKTEILILRPALVNVMCGLGFPGMFVKTTFKTFKRGKKTYPDFYSSLHHGASTGIFLYVLIWGAYQIILADGQMRMHGWNTHTE